MDFDTLLDVLELQLLIIKLHVLRLSLICLKDVMSRRRTHRWWIRPICRRRKHEGMFHTVMPQLLSSRDTDYFVKYFRMSSEIFHKLCESFSPKLQKFPRNREPISPEERTSIALRFLSSGTSINSIAVVFCVGIATADT